MEIKTFEEILEKHTGETGIYLSKGMIRGSDAIEAHREYMLQFTKKDRFPDEEGILFEEQTSSPETRNCLICGYFCNNAHHSNNWYDTNKLK